MSITFDISPDGGRQVHKISDAGFDFTEDASNEQTCLKGALFLPEGEISTDAHASVPGEKSAFFKAVICAICRKLNLPRLQNYVLTHKSILLSFIVMLHG